MRLDHITIEAANAFRRRSGEPEVPGRGQVGLYSGTGELVGVARVLCEGDYSYSGDSNWFEVYDCLCADDALVQGISVLRAISDVDVFGRDLSAHGGTYHARRGAGGATNFERY